MVNGNLSPAVLGIGQVVGIFPSTLVALLYYGITASGKCLVSEPSETWCQVYWEYSIPYCQTVTFFKDHLSISTPVQIRFELTIVYVSSHEIVDRVWLFC